MLSKKLEIKGEKYPNAAIDRSDVNIKLQQVATFHEVYLTNPKM